MAHEGNGDDGDFEQQGKLPKRKDRTRFSALTIMGKLKNVKRQGSTQSTLLPVKQDNWHEASHIYHWKRQAQFIVFCQIAPSCIMFIPSVFFHFFLKRDWGMAFGPFFAFAIYGDGSPRPFWIVPEVFLKDSVEEMSWGTPSAHSAIQGGICAVLLYYDYQNLVNSRLYLAVHWPQDIVLGALGGLLSGVVICVSGMHAALMEIATKFHPYGGMLYLSVGVGYNVVIYVIVKLLDRISDDTPVPEEAILRHKLGVDRATRILEEAKLEQSEPKKQQTTVETSGEIVEEAPEDVGNQKQDSHRRLSVIVYHEDKGRNLRFSLEPFNDTLEFTEVKEKNEGTRHTDMEEEKDEENHKQQHAMVDGILEDEVPYDVYTSVAGLEPSRRSKELLKAVNKGSGARYFKSEAEIDRTEQLRLNATKKTGRFFRKTKPLTQMGKKGFGTIL